MAEKQPKNSSTKYTAEVEKDVFSDMDPRLQEVVLRYRNNQKMDPALVQTTDEGAFCVDVIAELKDVKKSVPGLKIVTAAGSIVTAILDVTKIEEVRQHPNIVMLKAASKIGPQLHFSVPEIRAAKDELETILPSGAQVPNGQGVIIGVVDYGCDFLHKNFQNADGSTRILFLWDQDGEQTAISPSPYNYGREFDAAQINAALNVASAPPSPTTPGFPEDRNNKAYRELKYDPGQSSHGTHVLDTAAGNGRGSGVPGVAPGADLIFVDLGRNDVDEEEGNFGNSRRLLEAIDYVFKKAASLGRPAVVNLSVGTHGGPHDGSTPAEKYFDNLLETPGRAIVVAAGNSREHHRCHASGTLVAGAGRQLSWEVHPDDFTNSNNELEVWYPGDRELSVTLIDPSGERMVGPTAGGQPIVFRNNQQQIVARIKHRRHDSGNGDNHIQIFLYEPQADGGTWGVEVSNTGVGTVSFHAWIERDDFWLGWFAVSQSRFAITDYDPAFTLNSIACGTRTLAVGSYDATVPGRDLSTFSAEGPTRDGRQKPEVSAPGQGIIAARSLTHTRRVNMSGTSMATPHVTGMIALLLQAAERIMTIDEIREAVMETARQSSAHGNMWHSRYGQGRVDTAGAVVHVLGARLPVAAVRAQALAREAGTAGNGETAHDGLLTDLVRTAATMRSRIRIHIDVEPL